MSSSELHGPAVSVVPVVRFDDRRSEACEDLVAREEPLEIQLGGASLAVIMRTPGCDEELALGFLVTERVIQSPACVASLRHLASSSDPAAEDNVVRVQLAPGVDVDLESLRRNFYASSSCGICGKATLDHALASASPLVDASRFDPKFLYELPEKLERAQPVFARTGGLHAAGLFDADGRLLAVREDVGRHNAVDKVLGYGLLNGMLPFDRHVLLVSGRVSFEIVLKALAGRVPIVAAISAASSLAAQFATENDQTLVGFLRDGRMNIYANPRRIEVSGGA
jgi:FdhD protein